MDNLFVPYEIALELKAKGFNEECFAYWAFANNKKDLYYIIPYEMGSSNNDPCKGDCTAPTHQQVIDWFREEHNIEIFINSNLLSSTPIKGHITNELKRDYRYYNFKIQKYDSLYNLKNGDGIPTYYEALNNTIEEALKLI